MQQLKALTGAITGAASARWQVQREEAGGACTPSTAYATASDIYANRATGIEVELESPPREPRRQPSGLRFADSI